MRIWITGIAGFLGSHLAEALINQGYIVGGNDNYLCGDEDNIPVGTAYAPMIDCCDYSAMAMNLGLFKPDVVVHCAATAHEGLSSFSPAFITRNIYEASVSTFSAAIAAGAKRIVYMTSMARYGKQTPPFTEDMKPAPVDPYGVAKVAAEDTLRILAKTHNIDYTILVPHNIIGVRQRYVDPFRNVASIMINRCKLGRPPIIYGDGLQKRCFSPVKDCIPSILLAIHGASDGEVVNIGPDKGEITIKELADKVAAITDMTQPFIHMPDRPNEVKEAYTSSDKARKLLGYKEQQSIDDCLKEMVDAIIPQEFIYDFPIEIVEGCPKTWTNKLI